VLVLGLRHEREPPARRERVVLQRVQAVRDPGDVDDANARILPPDELLGLGVAQAEPVTAALEPEPEPPSARPGAQKSSSLRAASTTRSTDGMYASSICQYG
jgi:hypothetical protein